MARWCRSLPFFVLFYTTTAQAAPLCFELTAPFSGVQNLTPGIEVAILEPDAPPPLHNPLRWETVGNGSFHFGYAATDFWFRCDIKNGTGRPFSGFVSFEWALLDLVERYSVQHTTGPIERVARSGDTIAFRDWPVHANAPTFRIDLAAGETTTLLFRVRSTSLLSFPVVLYSSNRFLETKQNRTLFLSITITMIAIIALYNLVLFIQMRQSTHLYLSLMVLSIALAVSTIFGYAFGLLWPDAIGWEAKAPGILLALSMLTGLLFSRALFELSRSRPVLNRLFLIIIALSLCFIATIVFLAIPQHIISRIVTALSLLCFLLFLFAGALQFRRFNRIAKYLFAGWGIFLFTATIELFTTGETMRNLFIASLPVMFFFFTLANRERLRSLAAKAAMIESDLTVHLRPPESHPSRSYKKSHLGRIDTDVIAREIVRLMEEERLHQVEDLKIAALAQQLEITVHQLSEIFSTTFHTSFPLFLRDYRIRMACDLLSNRPEMSILDIAFECGFGSKTSFNRSFKEGTGLTPGEYRRFRSATPSNPSAKNGNGA